MLRHGDAARRSVLFLSRPRGELLSAGPGAARLHLQWHAADRPDLSLTFQLSILVNPEAVRRTAPTTRLPRSPGRCGPPWRGGFYTPGTCASDRNRRRARSRTPPGAAGSSAGAAG